MCECECEVCVDTLVILLYRLYSISFRALSLFVICMLGCLPNIDCAFKKSEWKLASLTLAQVEREREGRRGGRLPEVANVCASSGKGHPG